MRIVWTLLALIPILVGLSASVGWIAHVPILTELVPGYPPLVFNGAFCFALVGLGLLLLHHPSHVTPQAQSIIGTILLVISILTSVEILFHSDFHIDQIFLQDWLPTVNVFAGRMSLNSCIAFILCGMIFIFLAFARVKFLAMLIDVSIFILFLIGILGLTGYLLNVEFLYAWASYLQMSLLSSICITAISFSFWGYWRTNSWALALYEGHQDTKVILLSSAILLCVTLLVSLASFVTIAKQQINKAGETFQRILTDNSSLVETEINHVFQVINVVRSNVIYRKDMIEAGDINQSVKYQDVLNLFLAEGFTAVKISDRFGNQLISSGDFIDNPVFITRLNTTTSPSNLIWKDGWYLQVMAQINPDDLQSGVITAEWPLYNIDIAINNNQFVGKSGAFLICAPTKNDGNNCFSTKHNNVLNITQEVSSQFLPVDYALAGQSGVMTSAHYKDQMLLVAYGPIDSLGLGLIVEMDTGEIYEPIKENFNYILPVIAFSIVIGLMLLRLQVVPLVRRVLKAEQELLRTNKRLQESEERYSLAVRGSHVGLWDWNVNTGQVFYSPYFKTMMGYAEHEVPPKLEFFQEHLHPDDYDRVFKLIKEHLEHYVPYDIEYRLRQKSGEYHWYHAIGEALRDDQGVATRMAGSITDITERKSSAQRLSAQYSVIRILAEATNMDACASRVVQAICEQLDWELGVLWIADYQISKMRCIGFWNPSSLDAKNYEEMIRKSEIQIGSGLAGRVWNTAQPAYIFDIAIDKNFPVEGKELGLHSALCFPILLQNKVLGAMEFLSRKKQIPDESLIKMMTAIGAQIAQFIQRKSTEIALRESEGYKTAIVESASDCIMTIDKHDHILSFNPLTTEIFGYNADELNNKDVDLLIPGIAGKLKENQGKTVVESEGVRKNGQVFPVEISASVMHLHREDVYATIIRDVTERKKIERLKNEFISVVSHELRTPLTSIRGALGLIMGGSVDASPEKKSKLLAIATHNCDRLLLLINDILDTEKIESGKMHFRLKIVDINLVVDEAIGTNKIYAEKYETEIKFTERAQYAFVNVDPDRVNQVLTNLISNAVKFSPKNEKIIIKTKIIDNMVRVSVADRGVGIPVEFQTKIFQKFSQADASASREKGGTGLGLSISKSIIEKLGGSMGFSNLLDHGAVFYFDLPLWRGEETGDAITEKGKKNRDRAIANRPRILLVEDDPDTKSIVSTLLLGRATVINVESVKAAIEAMEHEKFDMAILDILLPDGNGIDLLPVFAGNKIPVVVFSAVELDKEYMQYVKHALVKSDTSNQELLEIINRILEATE